MEVSLVEGYEHRALDARLVAGAVCSGMAAQLEPERQEYARPNSISGGVGRGVGEFVAFFEQPAVLTGHRPADFLVRV
jgi:hypothetical protein